jgi:uncharacterized protein (TIGR02145 family)
MNKYKIATILLLLFIVFSCDPYDLERTNTRDPKSKNFKASLPTLTTTAASSITSSSAILGGKITADGGAPITARGTVWNTSTNPVITLATKTSDGTGTGTFTSNLAGLTSSTNYYARAYATNSSGTAYGNVVTFSTLMQITSPVITTTAASSIGLTKAVSGGNVTSDGGSAVTARGVCWSTTTNPTIALATKTTDSLGIGIFTSNITGLTAGGTYHVRAYATNSIGTSYGSDLTFTTLTVAQAPTVTTTAATGIAMTTAVSGGDITFDGGADVTARGICWSITANPTTALATKTSDGTGSGKFTSNITGLTAGTTYHIRAYATNSAGTTYGSDLTFITGTTAIAPTVTTTAVTDLTLNSLVSGGNVLSDGGADVTTRGVCWSITSNPTISNTRTYDGSGTGVFTSNITGLVANTTYHIRAYATNSVGTSYGADISVLTKATVSVPSVTTTALTSITSTSAASGGNITTNGGAAVTARGVCWSTTANPTVSLTTKTSDGSGSGVFTSDITGLLGGTTYHVRAYATNSAGTGYGADLTLTSEPAVIATITTTTVTDNVGTSATSGGNIYSDGGAPISVRGVCWGASLNPTTANSKTEDGTGSGSFVSSITALTIGTTYHLRAYATNSVGTAYGQDIAFTTPNIPTLTTSAVTSITPVSATSGGSITADGGAAVSERGICWSTTSNPTTALTTKVTSGSGTGTFYCNLTGLTASTTYYIRAYAINSAGTSYGDNVTFATSAAVVATVTTGEVTGVTLTAASSGGNVTATGGAAVTAKGVCWSTTTGPTVSLSTKTTDGSGTGTFTSAIASLSANTVYYLRAYATNTAGTAYGTEVIFKTPHSTLTDVEGNTYYAVQIGSQIWMRENLKTTKYRDLNNIVNVTDNTVWSGLTTGAYCWYNNDAATYKNTYGALYNWYTITDSRGLCPTGWHVPTDAEWTTLSTSLGGESVAGSKLKEMGLTHWTSPNTGATNETGFTGLGGGFRYTDGTFGGIGIHGNFWTATELDANYAYYRDLQYNYTTLYRSYPGKVSGLNIRCLKD